MGGDYLDGRGLCGIHGKGAQVIGACHQGAAGSAQGVAGTYREGVAAGALGRVAGGAQAGQAGPRAAHRFQRRTVRDPLQFALFEVEPAGIDHHHHQEQGQAEGKSRHQANRPALPGRAPKTDDTTGKRHRALPCRPLAERLLSSVVCQCSQGWAIRQGPGRRRRLTRYRGGSVAANDYFGGYAVINLATAWLIAALRSAGVEPSLTICSALPRQTSLPSLPSSRSIWIVAT